MSEADLIAGRRLRPPPGEDFWVFAYGSLMWRPGFSPLDSRPALLHGYHRAFCIYSVHYRGTPERPGLVLGLDRGGACRGRVLRVAARDAETVAEYLHAREMITGVYEPRWLPVEVEGGRRLRAATYVVDRRHAQYAGKLGPDQVAEIILRGRGDAGSNRDYLENTVRHLDDLGITDCAIHDLLRLMETKAVAVRPARSDPSARGEQDNC